MWNTWTIHDCKLHFHQALRNHRTWFLSVISGIIYFRYFTVFLWNIWHFNLCYWVHFMMFLQKRWKQPRHAQASLCIDMISVSDTWHNIFIFLCFYQIFDISTCVIESILWCVYWRKCIRFKTTRHVPHFGIFQEADEIFCENCF